MFTWWSANCFLGLSFFGYVPRSPCQVQPALWAPHPDSYKNVEHVYFISDSTVLKIILLQGLKLVDIKMQNALVDIKMQNACAKFLIVSEGLEEGQNFASQSETFFTDRSVIF